MDGVTDAVPDGLAGVSMIWIGIGGASNWDRPGCFPLGWTKGSLPELLKSVSTS